MTQTAWCRGYHSCEWLCRSACFKRKPAGNTPSLLMLPDSVLELVIMHSSPESAAKLQSSCRHLQKLLEDDWWAVYCLSCLAQVIAAAPFSAMTCTGCGAGYYPKASQLGLLPAWASASTSHGSSWWGPLVILYTNTDIWQSQETQFACHI